MLIFFLFLTDQQFAFLMSLSVTTVELTTGLSFQRQRNILLEKQYTVILFPLVALFIAVVEDKISFLGI